MPILTRQAAASPSAQVTYIDAFAGPGRYSTGEDGSPLVAITTARDHHREFLVPVHLAFIEQREDRFRHLSSLLKPFRAKCRNAVVSAPICGDAVANLPEILNRRRGDYKPTLVFLDQFGYSAVPLELIADVLADKSCEVFAFMNWRDLDRYISDAGKWGGIKRAFGGDEWKEVLGIQGQARSNRFLQLYDKALRAKANAEFSCSFALHDKNDRLLSWLIFCGNSDRGLEEMKRAMWGVDETGRFRFSDRHSDQFRMLAGYDQNWLANTLIDRLRGRSLKVRDIRHFVLTETPCYQFNTALSELEGEGCISVLSAPPNRRKGSFVKHIECDDFVVRIESLAEQVNLFTSY